MRQRALVLSAVLLASALHATIASAQASNFALTDSRSGGQGSGWTLTPSLVYQGAWDDNALLRGNGDEAPGDYVSGVTPRLGANFLGRRGEFEASYDGTFVLYRDLNGLDSYDQH